MTVVCFLLTTWTTYSEGYFSASSATFPTRSMVVYSSLLTHRNSNIFSTMTVTFWPFVIRKSNSSVCKKTEEKAPWPAVLKHKPTMVKPSRHHYLPHLTLDDEIRVIQTLDDGHLMLESQFRILLDHVGEGLQAYSKGGPFTPVNMWHNWF